MKNRKGWNYLAVVPLFIFVVTFILGITNFNTEDSISLGYIYFGFIPFIVGYLVSLGLSLGTVVASFKNLHGKSLK